jgi:hypothetical protein
MSDATLLAGIPDATDADRRTIARYRELLGRAAEALDLYTEGSADDCRRVAALLAELKEALRCQDTSAITAKE